MANSFADYSFINCEFPYSEFVKAAYEAQVERERQLLISFLVQYIDFIVFSGEYPFVDDQCPMDVLRDAALWNDPTWSKAAWNDPMWRRYDKTTNALHALRYCLRDRVCQDKMWELLLRVMVELNESARSAFIIHVFCPIVTPPIRWNDPHEMIAVDRFLQCYHDPATKWAVLEGFTEGSVEQARDIIQHYNQWRCERGLDPLVVDYAELELHLSEN